MNPGAPNSALNPDDEFAMRAPGGFTCRTALRVEADSDKALVMAHLRGLVADGLAEWQTLDDGTIWFSAVAGGDHRPRQLQ
jgi:hypothetical protein